MNSVSSVNRVENLVCWYTNADKTINKVIKLEIRIRDPEEIPDNIMITEMKPKNARYILTKNEVQLEGYDFYSSLPVIKETGRGVAIFVRKYLQVREVQLSTKYQELVSLSMRLHAGDKLLLGCIYRNLSSDGQNNQELRDLLWEMCNMKLTHICNR